MITWYDERWVTRVCTFAPYSLMPVIPTRSFKVKVFGFGRADPPSQTIEISYLPSRLQFDLHKSGIILASQ